MGIEIIGFQPGVNKYWRNLLIGKCKAKNSLHHPCVHSKAVLSRVPDYMDSVGGGSAAAKD